MSDIELQSLTGLWREGLLESTWPCALWLVHSPSIFLCSQQAL